MRITNLKDYLEALEAIKSFQDNRCDLSNIKAGDEIVYTANLKLNKSNFLTQGKIYKVLRVFDSDKDPYCDRKMIFYNDKGKRIYVSTKNKSKNWIKI